MHSRFTPYYINSLKENEIFVFGCHSTGQHSYGKSAFALEHFGAIMGQREGRQGQSYAIPTIGGNIGLRDIRKSVKRFTQYASEHPELHFLVTSIGNPGWSIVYGFPWPSDQIAPLFSNASKLSNVSLPSYFWTELDKSKFTKYREWWCRKMWSLKYQLKGLKCRLRYKKKQLIERSQPALLGALSPKVLYLMLSSNCIKNLLSLEEYDLMEGMAEIGPTETFRNPAHEEYIVNHNTKRAYILRGFKGKFQFKDADIDWESTKDLPEKVLDRIRKRETPFYSSGVLYHGYQNGLACVFWTVSPDGETYYLDKWGAGPQTDEKDVTLYGLIDTECKVAVKMQVMPKEKKEDFIKGYVVRPRQ